MWKDKKEGGGGLFDCTIPEFTYVGKELQFAVRTWQSVVKGAPLRLAGYCLPVLMYSKKFVHKSSHLLRIHSTDSAHTI